MEISSFQEHYISRMFALKDEMFKKVIQKVLGREVFADSELKDFQIVTYIENPGREFIGYKGNIIGEIVMFQREENNQIKMGFEFVPKTFID